MTESVGTSKQTQQDSFYYALKIQLRVIGALLMREILTRFGRHNLGFLWLFLEPMTFTLGIALLWYHVRGDNVHGLGISIIAFAITGYSTVLLWRNTVSRCGNAIEPNFSLLHHRNVRVIDLFAARIVLEVAGATISMVVLILIFMALDMIKPPIDPLTMIAAWILLAWFAAGLAMVVGILCSKSELIARFWHTLTYLLFGLSGAVFMVAWLPPQAQEVVLWLPMVHFTEMLRHGYFGNIVKTYEDPVYIITVNTCLTLAGLIMLKNAQNTLEAP